MYKVRMLVFILAGVLLLPSAVLADDVLAGVDLLQTVPGLTHQDFNGPFTIPADFFDPGSDIFTGNVPLEGVPLGSSPECPPVDLGRTDTIVKRLADASLPAVGSSDVIPIELVALQLRSVSPITVTYSGINDELWDIEITISPTTPSQGTMTITHSLPDGGTFDSQLQVFPLLRFTRQSDNAVRVIDGGQFGLSDNLVQSGTEWRHSSTELVCPDCGSNFLAGTDGSSAAQWQEAGMWAAHGVMIPCFPTVPVRPSTWGRIKALYTE